MLAKTPPAALWKLGVLKERLEARPGFEEWLVSVAGVSERAIAYPSLTGALEEGATVWLNATATALALGTGGAHFILGPAPLGADASRPLCRDDGHLMRMRYTPCQMRVAAAEEPGSPHHSAISAFRGLDARPVLVCELHSAAAAAAIAARAAAPQCRIAWVQDDGGALPLAYSRTVHHLQSRGVIDITVTLGQGFGGDLETVTLHSALVAACAAGQADLLLVTQGPGSAGTGSRFGFSGLRLVEALHAAATLGGVPLLAPRLSTADPRSRHRGVSHHTETMLACTHVAVVVPLATGLTSWCPAAPHAVADVDGTDSLAALQPMSDLLVSMGRSLNDDPAYWSAAAASGAYAAAVALQRESGSGR